ncbi:MAG TPA: heparan-alpha-glucosaminide N-acetyltransferase domain-containing protein [Acidobacteriota bacterium]
MPSSSGPKPALAEPQAKQRIDAIDFARGVAISLMILSHGVIGLLSFEQIPDFGLVPVHLITKFSSSLFILVFGIALAVAYGPHVGLPTWPGRRRRLLIRGVTILIWYKVLTIAEMVPRHSREEILDTLLYRSFPVFVEILGFYAIALLWIPFILPLWYRMPAAAKWVVPPGLALASWWLEGHFRFWGVEPLQAILVEHERFYTWGQLARAPLVFLGLLAGEQLLAWRDRGAIRLRPAAVFATVSAALFAGFLWVASEDLSGALVAIAMNQGKHPPELEFMLFSVAGACLTLALAFVGGRELAKALRPVTVIGTDALQAFIAHIAVICVFYRSLLGYWREISYPKALQLTLLAFLITWLWIEVLSWKSRSQRHAR